MKLLVIGGTAFLGLHVVEAARARGHEVTVFHRGRTGAVTNPGVEELLGDRDGGLDPLRGRRWDAVVDTCGYVPRVVRQSAELLAGAASHYTFTSSLSVYADVSRHGLDESAPVRTLEDESVEEVNGETYGGLKVLCERVVEECFPGRTFVPRAGLIVGPHDYIDRFTYWARQVAEGGRVLVGGRPDRPIQLVDARDLAEWIVRMSETGGAGVYNATGPDYPLTMGAILDESKSVTGSNAELVWVSDQFLLENKVAPWAELPLWLPEGDEFKKWDGFMRVDCSKAFAAGLKFRPLSETIRDTLAWDEGRADLNSAPDWMASVQESHLDPQKEAELLRAWLARS